MSEPATSAVYTDTANELGRRILALIPSHPEILTLDSPFGLFKIDDFKCDDLQPSLFQASFALNWARRQFTEQSR